MLIPVRPERRTTIRGETAMSSTDLPTGAKSKRTFEVSMSRQIAAPAAAVYGVFADYREAHPRILPPRFFVGLTVEQGGYGAGTIIQVAGRFAGRTRVIRGVVTEPEPGRLLVESYPAERMVTSFRVLPGGRGESSEVTISTVLPRRWGPLGWVEERIVRRLLPGVFAEELELVAEYLAGGGAPTSGAGSPQGARTP
jgi:hypothetical protein